VDLRGLEAVLAVYEHGSFSEAAAALYLSQPALTRRVAQLERELDTRLFIRSPRGVALTDTGRALIDPARRALREADSIRGALDRVRHGSRGKLSIVGVSNLLSGFGHIFATFHATSPEVELSIVSADTTTAATAMVEAGECDLAVVDLPLLSTSLIAHPLASQEFYAVLGAGSTGTDQSHSIPTVTAAMLAGRTMVHLPSKEFPKQRGLKLWEMMGVQPSSHMEVASCGLLVPISKSGRTVTLVPAAVAMIGRAEGLDLAAPPRPIRRTLAFARHPANTSAAVRNFVGIAEGLSRTIPQRALTS